MPVVVLQSAKDDLRDGYLFYERQGGAYLGNHFLAMLQGDLSSLALYAGIHNKRFGFYRALSRRYPVFDILRHRRWRGACLRGACNRRDPKWIYGHLQSARASES